MKNTIVIFILFLTLNFQAAGNNWIGGRSAGMSNASVALSDLWAVSNNQAGIAFLDRTSAGLYYENRFLIKELGFKAFALAVPLKGNTFGISITNSGYSLYSNNKFGLAFAKMLGKNFSAGIQLDYLNLSLAEGYGTANTIAAEAGIQAKLFEGFILGVHVFNLSQSKLATFETERIPTIMRIGSSYEFSDKVLLSIEVEKDLDFDQEVKIGLEYQPIEELFFRTGISTYPSFNSFGFGINVKRVRFDFSSTYHWTLGFSPQASIIYEL